MRYCSSVLFLLLIYLPCGAQKQANIWIFGRYVGLDFNTNPPAKITITPLPTGFPWAYGTSTISDSSGRLICWTDGLNAYGRDGMMRNGAGVGEEASGGQYLVVPKPGSDSLFYVFTSRFHEKLGFSTASYHYSIVNACLDPRNRDTINGDVVAGQKKVLLADNSTAKLCAASDDAGGYWIMGHRRFSDSFLAWHLTTTGLSAPVCTRIGPQVGYRVNGVQGGSAGQMKFNPAGNKIAMVTDYTRNDTGTLDIFDFNPATGIVSNHCQTLLAKKGGLTGVEFSPDGSKVFVAYTQVPTVHVLRLSVGSPCASVGSSLDTIYSRGTVGFGSLADLQAGPDGVIYVGHHAPNGYNSSVHRIINPNGMLRYDTTGYIFGTAHEAGPSLPSFVAGFKYHNRVPPCYWKTGVGTSSHSLSIIELVPNPAANTVRISAPGLNRSVLNLTLTDAAGRMAHRSMALPEELDLSQMPSGVYFWRVSGEHGLMQAGKLIVAH